MQRAQGFAEQGDQRVFTGGQTSANVVQGSFPRATVTVFLTGTSILATIYSNNQTPPAPLANPFTADSNGHWFFYAPDGRYDVRLSGAGLCPWTMSDLLLNESPGGGVNLKGSVATAGALPSTGNKIGDAYIARDTGHLWVWDGTQWIDVGPAGGTGGGVGNIFPFHLPRSDDFINPPIALANGECMFTYHPSSYMFTVWYRDEISGTLRAGAFPMTGGP